MLRKPRLLFDFISNMGFRYVWFRAMHVLRTKLGLLKAQFPTEMPPLQGLSLEAWRRDTPAFFFDGKNIPGLEPRPSERLKQKFDAIRAGRFTFFSYLIHMIPDGAEGWHTNPDSGYRYDINKHWTKIPDMSKEAGDIKFVWEKGRFTFLYDLIRYDYHFQADGAAWVFEQIESFIDHNPLNKGPHYRCSQEISLRILNWTFALYYYKESEQLTQGRFEKIMQSIHGQLHHVYHHIDFSRIAVRNNHALTETLMLYLSGLLFPFLPETKKWSAQGKKWFEAEVAYQIYEDGTFLQFSMNYHRVAVQLLTWALRLSELHGDRLDNVVYDRAAKSLQFLDSCTDPVSGELPNSGANDGALFFPLTDDDYRVYTSQLNDLRAVLTGRTTRRQEESVHWYGMASADPIELDRNGLHAFPKGGYYIAQEDDVKTFVRCGAFKDRPSQADNLHVDLWVGGVNYLWDPGSYKYNTEEGLLRFFTGTLGHNTVTVDGQDQMLKGERFIWFYWVKKAQGQWKLTHDGAHDVALFDGTIEAFRHLGGMSHRRVLVKTKQKLEWTITDTVPGANGRTIQQHWHLNPAVEHLISIQAVDASGNQIPPKREVKWYSRYYGTKQDSIHLFFETESAGIQTTIRLLRPEEGSY